MQWETWMPDGLLQDVPARLWLWQVTNGFLLVVSVLKFFLKTVSYCTFYCCIAFPRTESKCQHNYVWQLLPSVFQTQSSSQDSALSQNILSNLKNIKSLQNYRWKIVQYRLTWVKVAETSCRDLAVRYTVDIWFGKWKIITLLIIDI